MSRREELSRQAARLFAEKGYHGTSIGDLADSMGVQKGSLYAHIEGKEDLLYETMRGGAAAFHGALDSVPDDAPPAEILGVVTVDSTREHDLQQQSVVIEAAWSNNEAAVGEGADGVVEGRSHAEDQREKDEEDASG